MVVADVMVHLQVGVAETLASSSVLEWSGGGLTLPGVTFGSISSGCGGHGSAARAFLAATARTAEWSQSRRRSAARPMASERDGTPSFW